MVPSCSTKVNEPERGFIPNNPLDAELIEWDDNVLEHLALHHVSPLDVHQAVENGGAWSPNLRYGSDRWRLVSYNHGGRPLTLFFAYDEVRRALKPITGRTSKPDEISKYLK